MFPIPRECCTAGARAEISVIGLIEVSVSNLLISGRCEHANQACRKFGTIHDLESHDIVSVEASKVNSTAKIKISKFESFEIAYI